MSSRHARTLPIPDDVLRERVGGTESEAEYLRVGRRIARDLATALPADWSFAGKRVLDFGAGAGRVLRHLTYVAAEAEEFAAVDIDEASVDWMAENLQPPFVAYRTSSLPPLPFPTAMFDLVYAVSVFTHLTDTWWPWLAELRRVTRPGGHLLASFLERRPYEQALAEPFIPELVGMIRLGEGRSFAQGGPLVFHSEWWIRENWGALFDVVDILPNHLDEWQHLAVLKLPETDPPRRTAIPPRTPATSRHVSALETNVRLLSAEAARLREELEIALSHERDLERRMSDLETCARVLEADRDHFARVADERLKHFELMEATLSWRLTRPMRALRRFAGAARRDGRVVGPS